MESYTDLAHELELLAELVKENPCHMEQSVLTEFAKAVRGMLSSKFMRPMSRCQVARFYGVSERTIERWANLYSDFPKPRHDGHLAVSFSVDEVVNWKKNHPEHFARV